MIVNCDFIPLEALDLILVMLFGITVRFDEVQVGHPEQERHGGDGEDHEHDEDRLEAGQVYQGPGHAGEHELAEHLHGGEERVVGGLHPRRRGLRQRHHRREAGRGHQARAQVGRHQAQDGQGVVQGVRVERAQGPRDARVAPGQDHSVLQRDGQHAQTRGAQH